jgi:hypothetical protein
LIAVIKGLKVALPATCFEYKKSALFLRTENAHQVASIQDNKPIWEPWTEQMSVTVYYELNHSRGI